MDIGQEMPRHAHNSQFGGLLHCLALGWNHFVALVIFTFGDFWWTFSSLGAISSLQNYLYCQMLFAYTPLKWSVFILSKIVFIIAFFFLTLMIVFFRIKTQPWTFVSVLSIVGCFLYGSEEFPERLSDIGLGISLAHKPSHISHRPSLSVSK